MKQLPKPLRMLIYFGLFFFFCSWWVLMFWALTAEGCQCQ